MSDFTNAVCARLGCTPEQLATNYRKNAASMREMAAHPKRASGAKWQGYTATVLMANAARYDDLAKSCA